MRYNFQVCLKVAVFHRLCQVQQATSKQAAKAAPADLFPNPWCPPPSLPLCYIHKQFRQSASSFQHNLFFTLGSGHPDRALPIDHQAGKWKHKTTYRDTANPKSQAHSKTMRQSLVEFECFHKSVKLLANTRHSRMPVGTPE